VPAAVAVMGAAGCPASCIGWPPLHGC
jgi:hypothetical protein